MAVRISFYRGDHNAPSFNVSDRAYSAIGSMLTSDVQNAEVLCLDRLSWIEDVRTGTCEERSWEGNSWSANVSAEGLHLQDLYSDDWEGFYSLDEAHDVMIQYLDFLASDEERKRRVVAEWEAEYGREHPCRNHLSPR